MRLIEVISLILFTALLIGIVLPIPCLPPSCGPPDATPLSLLETIVVYLYQPLTWIIILAWIIAIVIWVRRYNEHSE